MRWKVVHTTRYEYADLVPFCQNVVYLIPRNTVNQTSFRHRLLVRPQPATQQRRTDYFGNAVTMLSVDQPHRALKITATSTVDVKPRDLSTATESPSWETVRDGLTADTSSEGLANYQFAFPSPHAPWQGPIRDYVEVSFAKGRSILDALAEVCGRLHADFEYDPRATHVSTPVAEVFELRRGVCQDLSHLLLSGLRGLGLAARYVSGYLRTHPADGQPRLVGADASHAPMATARHGASD